VDEDLPLKKAADLMGHLMLDQACVNTHILTYTHIIYTTHIHTYTHTHIHTYTHTHTHIHIHTHTHTHTQFIHVIFGTVDSLIVTLLY
jgi:hypothetical protein